LISRVLRKSFAKFIITKERQVEVPRVGVVQKLSYAEAVTKAEKDGSKGRVPERSGVTFYIYI
jgi:hypothetical protein